MISVQCPSCFHEMRVKDELLGKKVRCKACNDPVPVEVVEPPDDADGEPVFAKPGSSRISRARKRSNDSPAQIALQFAIRNSGSIALAILLIVTFVAICSSRQFARAGLLLFGGGGLLICGGAYAWALIQAAGEEPLALLGFVLPRYGLSKIFRHRERVHGPLPLFLLGVVAMGMGIISLRMSIPPAGGEQAQAAPQPPVNTAGVGLAAGRPAARPERPKMPSFGGETPVPTEAIESLTAVKRGMKVWAFQGRWEQGTVVGRDFAGWLIVKMSEGFHSGREMNQPLHLVRIEASELKRDDLSGIPPVTDEPPVVPGQIREFQEEFERARQKAMQGAKS